MKNSVLLIIGLFISVAGATQAAFLINRSSGSLAYRSLDSAIANAQNGDTLYLPGGTFNTGNIVIDKKILMFGAGHYPDSTDATGRTVLNGSVFFISGASLSVLHGVYLMGNITFGTTPTNSNINGLVISRCNFNDILLSFNTSTVSLASNILISQNVIRNDVIIMDAKDNLVENNLIDGRINSANGSNRFVNNIVFGRAGANGYTLNSIYSCIFENNIFYTTAGYGFPGNIAGNTFRNNVFGFANPFGGTDIQENNIFNATNLFVNQTLSVFSYEQNFHLKAGSAAIGAGKGGTDCGIYGGARPYKESAVPMNPHVQSKVISDNADNTGKINVQIKVAAQQQ